MRPATAPRGQAFVLRRWIVIASPARVNIRVCPRKGRNELCVQRRHPSLLRKREALEGYRSGKFPDGSVLIDDLLEIKESGGVTSEGARRRVAVMVKDGARYRDTGGWGFEVFKGDEFAPALNAEGKAACFACHGKQKDRDSVFSQFRK
jgi:hypothetical protein